jgi:glycosyltransferase involved in cell wall biosynthesis
VRVLFWSETFWPRVGGVERLAAGLLPALRDRGHEFEVVTWVEDGDTGSCCFEGIRIHRFPFFSRPRRDGATMTWMQLDEVRRLKRRFLPDLVHVNSCGHSAWFHLATNGTAPTVVTLHQPLSPDTDARESVTGRLLATASSIVCCSNAVLATVRRLSATTGGRASVIENALPARCAAPPPISFEPPRLLFVGRLVPEKGLDALMSSLPPLFARVPRARLVVAGDGPLRPQLEAQAAELGLVPYLRFLGAVSPDTVRDLMADASIVIAPSRIEGFGLVALEAAFMGRPVVATDVGGLPHVVQHGHTGLLVDVGNWGGFVRTIETLINDPAGARRLGAAARQRALMRFDWRQYVVAYDSLYRRLAG